MTDFRSWVSDQFHAMAREYRTRLRWITATVAEHCASGPLDPGQADAMLRLIRGVPVPIIHRYEGSVTEEEKAWYKGCVKPEWQRMREEAEEIIHKMTK